MPRALIAIDACAGGAFVCGVALIARSGRAADAAATYRLRIGGAMLAAAALFLAGFATMAWVTA